MTYEEKVLDIRTNWAIADAKRDEGLTTPEGIRRFDDLSYGPYGVENLLDIYVQKGVTAKQPTIVNIHGGGWTYGSKEVYQFYCMNLAQRGFTVVNINYRLAPESHFPAAVEDINQALTFLEKQGADYFVDKDRLILIGDSAGGQLVSHYATVVTNPEFAARFDFKVPDITLKAVGLHCGAYFAKEMIQSGTDDFFMGYIDCLDREVPKALFDQLDAAVNMTKDFPPAFIMSAQNDFLLGNVEPMYRLLSSLGVPCEQHVYGTKEQLEVAHVFEVNIKHPEATRCNDEECAFFKKYV